MNQYTQLLYYIKELADSDEFINTVTQGDWDKLDLDKANVFPIVHINVTAAGFTNGSTVTFDIQLGCFSLRDINKEIIEDKFWQQDNEVDNLNETLAVLNKLWGKMYKDFADNNITSSENPTLEPTTEYGKNLMDGWIMTFTVEMPNTSISLCQ